LCCQPTNLGREREFSDRSTHQMHNGRYKPRVHLTESTATAPRDIWILAWSLAWSQQILLLHLLWWWWWWCICSQARSIQNLLNKLIKAALHIDAGLGTSLKEQASMFAGESNSFFLAHSTFGFFRIHFVADQHLDAILVVAVSLHFLEPYIWQIRERRSSCHIIHQYHSLCSSAIRARQRSCPAVSQIVSFSLIPCSDIIFSLKSTPIVGDKSSKVSDVKRRSRLLLPTPESPIKSTFKRWSNSPPVSCRHRYLLRPQMPTLSDPCSPSYSSSCASSSSPRIKSFPQILPLLLHRESKAFHKSFFFFFFTKNQKLSTNLSLQFLDSRSVLFRLFPRWTISSSTNFFFFQKATITHATRSISYASSRRPTSPSLSLSLSHTHTHTQQTNNQNDKTTLFCWTKVPISFFFWVLGYTK